MVLEPGEQIDIWVVEAALGSGGMGSVYRCHNRSASRIMAAIKVLESGLRRHPEAEARFVREAEILFQLDHPSIVKVRNIRTESDPPYLEMEFVEGESLEERLRRGALPFDAALVLMEQCASALAYLHDKGVRHRDIKPANLLVKSDGRVKLVDFGLAMEADTSRITQQGMAFGTVSYAPPEWIAPDTLDPARWDIYALGVVFWELLTGKTAFPVSGQGSARQQAMQVIVGKQNHAPLDPGAEFHDDLRELVRDMTRSQAAERIATAAEVHARVQALTRSLRHEPGVTLAPGPMDLAEYEEDSDETSMVSEPPELPPAPVPREGPNTWSGIRATPVPATPRTPPPAPGRAPVIEQRSRKRAGGLLALASMGGAVAVGGVLLLVLVAGAAAWWVLQPTAPDTRAVRIEATPSDRDLPLSVALDGRRTDATLRFDAVPVGEARLDWALGEGCVAPCTDGCPAWCGTGHTTRTITAGDGPQEEVLQLPTVPTHTATVLLPQLEGLDDEVPVTVRLGARSATPGDDGWTLSDVTPGEAVLTIRVGDCPAGVVSCWPDDECPPGCTATARPVAIPWDAPEPLSVTIPPPTAPAPPAPIPAPAEPEPAPAPEPEPTPTPTPTPDGTADAHRPGGGQVKVGEFAAWLADNPQFQPDGPKAGRGSYLKGWNGATPPAGLEAGDPVVHVDWGAATAYCRSMGRDVAHVDAEPLTFAGAPLEWRRRDGGHPAQRTDGQRLVKNIDDTRVSSVLTFRCTR